MKNTFLLLIIFVTSSQIFPQESDPRYIDKQVFPFGIVETFHSNALNEDRVLNIYLPDGYNPEA